MSGSRAAGQASLGRADRWGATAVYGAAHLGKSLLWYGGELLFAYFLTELAGLPSAWMAVVLASGLLVSAALDLAVGNGMRRGPMDAASAARLQALGAGVSAAALMAFVATPFVPTDLKLIWALTTGVAFRVAYSFYDVPQNALMSLATADPEARRRMAAVRMGGSGLATIAAAAAVAPLLAQADDMRSAARLFLSLAAAASLVAAVSAAALSTVVGSTQIGRNAVSEAARQQRSISWSALTPLLTMAAVMAFGPPLFQKLEPYFAARLLESPAWGGAVILGAAIGVCAGQPFWLFLAQRSRMSVYVAGAVLQALGAFIFVLAPLRHPELLVASSVLFGLGNGGLSAALWASFSDFAARLYSGREGLVFAIFTAVAKAALAAGVGVVGWVLNLARSDHDVLRTAMALGPIAASLLVVVLARASEHAHARPWKEGDG